MQAVNNSSYLDRKVHVEEMLQQIVSPKCYKVPRLEVSKNGRVILNCKSEVLGLWKRPFYTPWQPLVS